MRREEALSIVREYVKNENLVRHMLAVEAAMRFYAELLNEEVETCGPQLAINFQSGIQAVLSHADHTGVPRRTSMEKALFACDEVTGLITAVALVRPSRSLYDLKASSVKKKWKDKSFAAGANRDEIARAADEFGVELWQHVDQVILAMRRIAPDLDLEGNP